MSKIGRIVRDRQRAVIPSRLLRGAEILGRIRKAGQFCVGEWSRTCPCDPRSEFCDAKLHWIELVEELHQGPPFGLQGQERFYLAEAMTIRQWEATGLTALVELPGLAKPLRVGPRGTTWKTIMDLACVPEGDDLASVLEAVQKIQEAFQ